MTSLLMTSSGSTDVALGNIPKEQVFESRRSPFSELRRLSCGAHHATSFQQVQIQTDGIRPGLGMRLAVLHPDSLHPDSLHGDQVCDGDWVKQSILHNHLDLTALDPYGDKNTLRIR